MTSPGGAAGEPVASVDAVRFGVRAVNGAHSLPWRLWTTPPTNDVYLTVYRLGREFKVSLHQSGRWRVGLTKEHVSGESSLVPEGSARTFGDPWDRPPPFSNGWTRAFGVIVPWFEVVSRAPVETEVRWVPPPAIGRSAVFTVLFAPAGSPTPSRFFAGPYQAQPVGSVTLANGERVWVTWHEEPFTALHWEQWRDLRATLAKARQERGDSTWDDVDVRSMLLSVAEDGCRHVLELSMPGRDAAPPEWTPEAVVQRNDVLAGLRRVAVLLGGMDVRAPTEVPTPFSVVFGLFSRVRSLLHAAIPLLDRGLLNEAAALLATQCEEAERLRIIARAPDSRRLAILTTAVRDAHEADLVLATEAAAAGIAQADDWRVEIERRIAAVDEYLTRHGLDAPDNRLDNHAPGRDSPAFEEYLAARRASTPSVARMTRTERLDAETIAFMSHSYDPALFEALARLAQRMPLVAAAAFSSILKRPLPADIGALMRELGLPT